MQGVVFYGRFLARALVSSLSPNLSTDISRNKSPLTDTKSNSLRLVTASAGLSKSHSSAQVQTAWSFGDDACFVADHKKGDVIGVADGVGGWRDYGVDPSQFPKSLMNTCERMVRMGKFTPSSPKTILAKSYQEIQENKEMLIGSCTACLVSLHRQENTIYTSNLGDSGFMVIREGKVIQRSEEQQHYFNTPFQLAMVPTVLEGMVLSDMPEAAETSSFDVVPGDIILVGTDGLFDNMKEETILQHLSKLKDSEFENIQNVADVIAQHAHQLAFDSEYMSPFAQNAQRNGIFVQGGKPDDITVLLARVSEVDPFSDS